jgi:hypothetical protein
LVFENLKSIQIPVSVRIAGESGRAASWFILSILFQSVSREYDRLAWLDGPWSAAALDKLCIFNCLPQIYGTKLSFAQKSVIFDAKLAVND